MAVFWHHLAVVMT